MSAVSYPSEYLEFIRLFNEKKFFEAHEVLEGFWRKEKGSARNFYQGLIQLAAVFVHLEKRNRTGAERLFQTASDYLKPYGPIYQGLELGPLLEHIRQVIEKERKGLEKPLTLLAAEPPNSP